MTGWGLVAAFDCTPRQRRGACDGGQPSSGVRGRLLKQVDDRLEESSLDGVALRRAGNVMDHRLQPVDPGAEGNGRAGGELAGSVLVSDALPILGGRGGIGLRFAFDDLDRKST